MNKDNKFLLTLFTVIILGFAAFIIFVQVGNATSLQTEHEGVLHFFRQDKDGRDEFGEQHFKDVYILSDLDGNFVQRVQFSNSSRSKYNYDTYEWEYQEHPTGNVTYHIHNIFGWVTTVEQR